MQLKNNETENKFSSKTNRVNRTLLVAEAAIATTRCSFIVLPRGWKLPHFFIQLLLL